MILTKYRRNALWIVPILALWICLGLITAEVIAASVTIDSPSGNKLVITVAGSVTDPDKPKPDTLYIISFPNKVHNPGSATAGSGWVLAHITPDPQDHDFNGTPSDGSLSITAYFKTIRKYKNGTPEGTEALTGTVTIPTLTPVSLTVYPIIAFGFQPNPNNPGPDPNNPTYYLLGGQVLIREVAKVFPRNAAGAFKLNFYQKITSKIVVPNIPKLNDTKNNEDDIDFNKYAVQGGTLPNGQPSALLQDDGKGTLTFTTSDTPGVTASKDTWNYGLHVGDTATVDITFTTKFQYMFNTGKDHYDLSTHDWGMNGQMTRTPQGPSTSGPGIKP